MNSIEEATTGRGHDTKPVWQQCGAIESWHVRRVSLDKCRNEAITLIDEFRV